MLSINAFMEDMKKHYATSHIIRSLDEDIGPADENVLIVIAPDVSDAGFCETPVELEPDDVDAIDTSMTSNICILIGSLYDTHEFIGVVSIEENVFCVMAARDRPLIAFVNMGNIMPMMSTLH